MLQDALRETPAYQRILEEGREEGRQALQKELKQQQEALREAAFDVTLRRFPHLVGPAREYAKSVDDLCILTRFVVRMATIPTVEGAEVFLQIMIEESEETK